MNWVRALWRKLLILNDTLSFRYKIMGLVLGITLLLGMAITWQTKVTLEISLRQQLDQRALATAKAVAAQSSELILTGNLYSLHQMLLDMLKSSEDIRYIFIQDLKGRVLSHTFGPGFPIELLKYSPLLQGRGEDLRALRTNEGLIHEAIVPILGGQLGFVRVGLSEVRLKQAIIAATIRFLITVTMFSIFFIIAGFILTEILARPVRELVNATKAIGKGDLKARVNITSRDEFGYLASSFNQMVNNLKRSRAEIEELSNLRAELLDRVVTTQEAERQRIARELHDETGGALTAILLRLKALEKEIGEGEAASSLRELREMVAEALNGVRRIALELRPVAFEELGLTGVLKKLAQDYSVKFNLEIYLETTGLPEESLSSKAKLAIYRIVQEALNNIIKHAGASRVSIILEPRGDILRLIVEDNGRGFDQDSPESKRGLGLFSMRERVHLLGGKLVIESQVGQGTTIYADIPLAS